MGMVNIGFFIGSTDFSGYEIQLIESAIKTARESGVRLVCLEVGYLQAIHGGDSMRSLLYSLVDAQHFDALIFSPTVPHSLNEAALSGFFAGFIGLGIPLVSIGSQVPGVASVIADNAAGMGEVMDHLLDVHGFRRFAYVGGIPGQAEAEVRSGVFRQKLAVHGIQPDPRWQASGDFSQESGYEIVRQWLASGKLDVEVIVCANDGIALGAHDALRQAGIRVPEDIALTGFDNDPACAAHEPALTSIHQNTGFQGAAAIRLALRCLRSGCQDERVRITSQAVIRESCGCRTGKQPPKGSGVPADSRNADAWKGVEEDLRLWLDGGGGAALTARIATIPAGRMEELQDFCFSWCARADASFDAAELSRVFARQWAKLGILASLRTEEQAKRIFQIGNRLAACRERESILKVLAESLDDLALVVLGFKGLWLSLFRAPERPGEGLVAQLAIDGPAFHRDGPGVLFASNDFLEGGFAGLEARHDVLLVNLLYQQTNRKRSIHRVGQQFPQGRLVGRQG
jgi:DNA-binding LacI/PurR family transcriptional regulator